MTITSTDPAKRIPSTGIPLKTTDDLRLRSSPEILPDNIIATLPAGTMVSVAEEPSPAGEWMKVNAQVGEKYLTGYVSKAYVGPEAGRLMQANIPKVDLPIQGLSGGKRSSAEYRAFPLNETDMVQRDEKADGKTRIAQLYRILDYLDVQHSLRYKPGSGVTYCNVYAYDFGTLANAYIPRVWWTNRSLTELRKETPQQVRYGDTVQELNANSLYDWFEGFGDHFGWARISDLDELQSEVNTGKVGVIVGQRKALSRPGHIDIVIPEYESFSALRNNGKVIAPLQSQAGAVNRKIFTSRWFLSANFGQYGFWLHE